MKPWEVKKYICQPGKTQKTRTRALSRSNERCTSLQGACNICILTCKLVIVVGDQYSFVKFLVFYNYVLLRIWLYLVNLKELLGGAKLPSLYNDLAL